MRKYFVLIFALLGVLFLPSPVLATAAAQEKTETVDIASLEYPVTCLFSIGWENGDLFSTLISPDGIRYPEDVPAAGITIAKREGITIFRVDAAQAGMWRVEIKGNATGELAILAQKITAPLVVGDITASQADDMISIDFQITGEPGECQYEVSLALNGQTSSTRVLQTGTANTGGLVHLSIPAQDVSTWPEYIIKIHAEMNRNGFTDFNDASSSVFSYINKNGAAPVSGATATFLDSRAVMVSWPLPEGVTDQWLGAALADHKIITSATAGGDAVSLIVPLPDALTGSFSIQLSRMINGIAGEPVVFEFDGVPTFESITGISLPKEILVNTSSLSLAFITEGPVSVTVSNKNTTEDKPLTYSISGDGTFSIPLREGQNRLVLTAAAEDGLSASTEIRLVSDTNPPFLRVMQDWDGIVTDVSYLRFSGNADRDAAVSVNGQSQKLDQTGNFSSEVSLTPGKNTVTVLASDKAGNTVQYEANVIRAEKQVKTGSWTWLLLIAIVVPLLIIGGGLAYYFINIRGGNGRNGSGNQGSGHGNGQTVGSKRKKHGNSVSPITTLKCFLISFLLIAQPACSTFSGRSKGSLPETKTEYSQADAVYMDGVIEAAGLYLDDKPMEALDLLHLVLRDNPDDVQTLLATSRIRIRMGDVSAAIDGYQELARRYEGVDGPVTDEEIDLMTRWLVADPSERSAVLEEWQATLESVWDDLSSRLPEEKVDPGSESVMNRDADLVNNLLDLSDQAASGHIDAEELQNESGNLLQQLGDRTDSVAVTIQDTLSILLVLSETAPDVWTGEATSITNTLAEHLSEDNPNIDLSGYADENDIQDVSLPGFETSGPEESYKPDQSSANESTDEVKPDQSSANESTSASSTEESASATDNEDNSLALPAGLDGTLIRNDLSPLMNVCALEMTTPGRIRMFVTVAEGSQGYSGGTPTTADFEFRTNLGFQYLLDQQLTTAVQNVERYTILLIDRRPDVSAENLALEKAAAAAFINSMAEGEKALVVSGGIPGMYVNFAVPSDSVQLFGNMEMETFLPTSDKAVLLAAVNSDYGGDSFDNPDIIHMLSFPLSVMTAIAPVQGDWNTFQLSSATPRFCQLIAFTDGQSGQGIIAGGDKTVEFLRGAAITANAAIHIVGVGNSMDDDYLTGLAAAGRGNYVKASRDSLMSFYSFIRSRQVSVFLSEASISGSPENDFFELWCRRTPDDSYAGFMHNAGAGVDLVGTAQYSDEVLGPDLFHDSTGDTTDGTGTDGGNPFETDTSNPDTSNPDTSNPDTNSSENGTDATGTGDGNGNLNGQTISIGTPDRHTIARGSTGLVMIRLSGEGFSGLTPQQVRLYVPEIGCYISKDYIAIASDTEIRFFLTSAMEAGTYSLNVTIGTAQKNFPDTFYVYDAAAAASITFGPYTLTGSALSRGDSDTMWNMTGTTINGYIRFDGNTQIDGDWLFGTPDDLTLTPSDNAYIIFDPDSDDFFVNAFYLDDGDTMPMGYLQAFDLHRDGSGTQWVEQPAGGGYIPEGVNFGFINIPFNLSTLYPDRIEMPIINLDLDLPLQEYFLNKQEGINFSATLESTMTVRSDALDLAFKASIGTPDKLVNVKLFGGMDIKKLEIDVDTSVHKIGLDAEVKLIGEEEIKAHLVFLGWLPDEVSLSVGVKVPIVKVPPSPIDVNLTELGGGVEGLAAVMQDPSEILGMTVIGTAKFTSGDINTLVPFLSPILDFAGEPPPLLATDNTELRLRIWPFSLSFGTDVKLLDAFQMGHAELAIGCYSFTQSLLGITDEDAVGLHALLSIGPDIDLKFVRVGYAAGPSLDINNHGLFISATGGAWAGINLGFTSFTADFTGTFLIAVHDIEDSDWPQMSIVLYAKPDADFVGLWDTDTQLDIRLFINNNGVELIGIPSPLDTTLTWLDDQASAAADMTWDAVTEGMSAAEDLADETWELAEDGYDFASDTGEAVQDAIVDGAGEFADTAEDVIDFVDGILPDPPTASGVGSAITGAWHALW